MLIVNAEVDGRPALAIRVRGRRIVAVDAGLRAEPHEVVLDASGGAVLPGLHDHHVHLRSAAAAAASVALDPATIRAQGGFEVALRSAATALADGAWLRGIGLHGDAFERLDRHALDAIVAERPVRLQHRGGALWLLNSAAVRELGVDSWGDAGVERFADGSPTGRLWRLDHRVRTPSAGAPTEADGGAASMRALSDQALHLGITGFTDATPDRSGEDIDGLAAQVATGVIRQAVMLMAPAHTGVSPLPPRVTIGAHKIILDDRALPDLNALDRQITGAHADGSAVAVHCVTAEQLVVAIAALDSAGSRAGDRIEHAGIVPPGTANVLARLGVTVVTQPGFIAARGDDYLRDVPEPEQPWLYPCRSLLAAGVSVAASSDAPFGPLDPWLAMSTAVSRRAPSGAVVGAHERVDPATALRLYLGSAEQPGQPRRVAPGEPGELCILGAPLRQVLADLGAHQVAAVVIDDEVHEWSR